LPIDKILAVAQNAKQIRTNEWMVQCPCHQDNKASLHITEAEDGRILLKCHAGCDNRDIVKAWGLEMKNLFTDRDKDVSNKQERLIDVTYDYKDLQGKLIFQTIRYEPKDFRQRRPGGTGDYIWNLQGVEPIPYRLPELKKALYDKKMALIVEGEKDVENLLKLGFTATCNHGGAGKWRESHSKHFPQGSKVTVLPDNDDPGRKHGQSVAQQLQAQGCEVRIVKLPGILEKGDVSDWLQTHNKDDLMKLIDETWDKPQEQLGPKQEPKHELESVSSKGIANNPLKPVITCLKDVQEEAIKWLWERYIALRKICIIEGDPSHGKTWFVLFLVSAISNGWKLPDPETGVFSKAHECKPANVIYMTAEDGLADTIKPRLSMLGANHKNIYILEGQQREDDETMEPVSMQDLAILRQAMEEIRPALLVFDPLQGYLGPNIDMNQANKTRPVLTGILRLAEEFECAVVIIRHLNKQNAGKVAYRGMGSIDFTAAARTVLLIGKDPENEKKRVIIPTKCNISFEGTALVFELDKELGFSWLGKAELTAEELLYPGPKDGGQDREQNRFNEAIVFLQNILAGGKKLIKEVKAEAKSADVKEITLRRAKENLEIKTFKRGENWFWMLPDVQDEPRAETMINMNNMNKTPENTGLNHVDHKKSDDQDEQDASNADIFEDSSVLITLVKENTIRDLKRSCKEKSHELWNDVGHELEIEGGQI